MAGNDVETRWSELRSRSRIPCYSGSSGLGREGSWRPLRGLSRRRSRVRVPSLPLFTLDFAALLRRFREKGAKACFGSAPLRRPETSE